MLTCCSVEKINIFTREGWCKVIGTAVCISGAVVMLISRGAILVGNEELEVASHDEMIMGTLSKNVELLASGLLKYGI